VIPVDGKVVRGEATVNQAVMTGESMPVHRYPGTSVYAGTIVEDGDLLVRTTAFDSGTRISRIVKMIEESDGMKARIQGNAERLADAVVPYSFLLAGAVFVLTGSLRKATSALLVDYSCAIKLSTPLSILSAMREGAKLGVVAKGGRILEKIAEADTVVFDKTGTLTVASPTVAAVIPFDGWTRRQILRTSACLEEHFPHSIARAVVKKAEEEELQHREEHADVEYAVAHGIVSRIGDRRVIIGSEHFVLEDEKIAVGEVESAIIEGLSRHYSLLYLAIGEKLAGVICIEDPLREEAEEVIRDLRGEGIEKIVMLTGDNYGTAEYVASQIGLDHFSAMLLPERKTEFINELQAGGAKVIMIGDGINDSPALSAAYAGIAMKESADIAREISDVVLTKGDLRSVVTARRLSTRLMRRIHNNYAFIITVNSVLLALGLSGVITPAFSALLHNMSTIGSSLKSLGPLIGEEAPEPVKR
jgi:heavy metal translocating P-type ATPase